MLGDNINASDARKGGRETCCWASEEPWLGTLWKGGRLGARGLLQRKAIYLAHCLVRDQQAKRSLVRVHDLACEAGSSH